MKTLLVTGASGYLGWHLSQLTQPDWQVYGTYLTQSLDLPGVKLEAVDMTDTDALKDFLQWLRPDAIIHTAAQSKPNLCEQAPDAAFAINVVATQWVAEYCARADIPCVFTSTDLVFDGQAAPYEESAAPAPINLYGHQKAEAERRFLAIYPDGVVCRMPLMFGGPTPRATCFLQEFVAQLQQSQPLKLFTDEYRTPIHIEDAARGLLLALEQGQGILHLGGQQRISRYDFGLVMADVFGFSRDLILPSKQADVPMAASRPPDVSMVSDRAFGLGYAPRKVVEALQAIASDWPVQSNPAAPGSGGDAGLR
ncbi:MAG TPA: NAD(P)-dependent oxidoreductase [Leptolyngbyaceae cyanobacterium]